MTSAEISERCDRRQEALILGHSACGLVFMNQSTGELTASQDDVLEWILAGDGAEVHGYYQFVWDGNNVKEVWVTDL